MVRRIDTHDEGDGEDGRISQPLPDDAWRPRRRHGIARAAVAAAKAIGWILFAALALFASAWAHVFTPLARDVVRDIALEQVNQSIEGRVAVDRIGDVDWGRVAVSGLKIYDAEGREVAALEDVSVEPDIAAMVFAGTVHFDEIRASDGHLALIETPEGPPSIATAFQARSPKPDTGNPAPAVEIDELHVEEVRVTSTYEPIADLSLVGVHLSGEMTFDDGVFEARLDRGGFLVRRAGRDVAKLASIHGDYDGSPGGEAELHAALEVVPDGRIEVDATAQLAEEKSELPEMHAQLALAGLGPDEIRALGLDPAKLLGDVSGTLAFDGTPEDFRASADLSTAGGDLLAEATLANDRLHVQLRTSGLDAGRVWAGAAVPRVSGTIEATAAGISHPNDMDVSARVTSLRAGEWRLPAASLAAHVGSDSVRVESLSLPYLHGDVGVRGTIGFDGSADLHLAADVPRLAAEPNLRRMFPGIRGSLDADVDLELHPTEGGAPPRIRARGEAVLTRATLGPVQGRRLAVSGTAHGSLSAPVVDLDVQGRSVRIAGQVEARTAELSLEGGPESYELTGRAVGKQGERLAVQADIQKLAAGGFEIDAQGAGENIRGRTVGFTAENVHVKPSGQIEIGAAELRSGETAVHVSGTYDPRGGSNLETRIEHLDAALVADLLGLEHIEGKIEGDLDFSGSPKRPEIHAMLWYTGGTLEGVYVDDVALVLDLSTRAGTLDGQIAADFGTHGGLSAQANARFDARRGESLLDALRDARVDLVAESRDLSLALVNEIAPDLPRLGGLVDGRIEAHGTMERPEVAMSFETTDLQYDGGAAFQASFQGTYADEDTRLVVRASDENGRLGEAELSAEVDLPAVIRDPSAASRLLDTQPWEIALDTAARRLEDLPKPLEMDVPARAMLAAHVVHRPDAPLSGEAIVGVTWLGDVQSCANPGVPRARAHLEIGEGRGQLTVVGRLGSRKVLDASAAFAAPVDEWLRGGMPEAPPVIEGRARLYEMSLEQVPFVCRGAMGSLSGEIEIADLFGERPSIVAALTGHDIRYGEAPPSELDVQLRADDHEAVALLDLQDVTGGGIRADARVPLTWRGPLPALANDGAFAAHVDMEDFHIEPLVAVPAFAFAEGTLDADIDVTGSVREPTFDGFIELDDVAFGLVKPAQRFEEGTGRIIFHESWIEIERLHFHDLGGTIRVSGGVGLDGLAPKNTRLAVYADDLPIRSEGIPIGELTAQAHVRANIGERKIEVWLRAEDMSVEVEKKIRTNVQSLEPHPDIVLVEDGEPMESPEEEEAPELVPMDVVVHVNATDPFWVRREDFAVQLQSRLDVTATGQEVHIGGFVDFRRGWLELLGKRFELEEGRVDFIGGRELNPRINILMSHDLESRSGHVFVRVVGFLQQPELEFSSDVAGVETTGEVLALLTGQSRGGQGETESSAAAQASSALAGITAGLLTLTARRELGDVFPDISIEATDRGARLRAGLDADRLIPSFLEGVIKEMYIEGFVGTGGRDGNVEQADTRPGAAGGVAVELVFPYSIVGELELQPPTNWAADVTYEP